MLTLFGVNGPKYHYAGPLAIPLIFTGAPHLSGHTPVPVSVSHFCGYPDIAGSVMQSLNAYYDRKPGILLF